ncbi:luciferase domain-containing protein [Pedobacter sp. PWIIR3]
MKTKSFFSLVVRYLGFFKRLPLFPHVFDSLLMLLTLLTRPYLLDWFDEIENEVLSWEDTYTSLHKYGGLQFNAKGKEIGHLHGNGLLDIPYSRKAKALLLKDGRVEAHHVFRQSGWISFNIINYDDKRYAVELLEIAYNLKVK